MKKRDSNISFACIKTKNTFILQHSTRKYQNFINNRVNNTQKAYTLQMEFKAKQMKLLVLNIKLSKPLLF